MKTKADRLWEEFGRNLAARIEAGGMPTPVIASAPTATMAAASTPISAPMSAPIAAPAQAVPTAAPIATAPAQAVPTPAAQPTAPPLQSTSAVASEPAPEGSWWSRVFGGSGGARPTASAHASGQMIRVEVRQMDKTISVEWPVEAAAQCKDWLQSLMK